MCIRIKCFRNIWRNHLKFLLNISQGISDYNTLIIIKTLDVTLFSSIPLNPKGGHHCRSLEALFTSTAVLEADYCTDPSVLPE